MVPTELLYHPGHEWVRIEDGRCVVGITDFAQSEMEEIVHVELPALGAVFTAGAVIGSVESIKAVAELFTPIGGRVARVNEELAEWPAYLNEDPHGKGWLIELEGTSPEELAGLLSAAQYEELIGGGEGGNG